MARLAAVLGAIGRAVSRDLGTFGQLKTNNIFLFIALLIYSAAQSGVAPISSYPLLLLLITLLLFPLSADPLEKVPASRLAMWPISQKERITLRLMSLAMSPVLWLIVLLLIFKRKTSLAPALLGSAVAVQVIAALGRALMKRVRGWSVLRYVPPFPGKLGGLIRSNVRQILVVLDFYIALAFSVGGGIYLHFDSHADPAAPPIISLLVALAMSTYAQCLFGLDRSSSAVVRYRVLPLKGWEVLLAKDAAFLLVLAVLLAPIGILPGLSSGLIALAVGHDASTRIKMPLRRWRLSGSRLFPGLLAGVGGIMIGFAEHQRGVVFFAAAVAIWAASLALYGTIFWRDVTAGAANAERAPKLLRAERA